MWGLAGFPGQPECLKLICPGLFQGPFPSRPLRDAFLSCSSSYPDHVSLSLCVGSNSPFMLGTALASVSPAHHSPEGEGRSFTRVSLLLPSVGSHWSLQPQP